MEYTTNSLFKIAVRPSNKVGGTKDDWEYESKTLTAYNICKRFGAKWETVNKYGTDMEFNTIDELIDALKSEGHITIDTGDKFYQFYYDSELSNKPGVPIDTLKRHPDFEKKTLSTLIYDDILTNSNCNNKLPQKFIQRAKEKKEDKI